MGAVDQTARRRRVKPKPDPESTARLLPPLASTPTGPPGKQTPRVHRGKPTTTHPHELPAGLYPGTDRGRQPGRAVQPPESSCGRGVSTGPFEKTPEQQRSWEARANTHLEISGGDGLGQCLKDRTMPCSLRRLP